MGKLIDLAGKRFGNLVVVKRESNKGEKVAWLCKCDCGNYTTVIGTNMKLGKTVSCGCVHFNKIKSGNPKHGHSKTKLYHIWLGMKQRCTNADVPTFKYYGGRGITVCEEWAENFQSFYDWSMQNGYKENSSRAECTLDRIDTDKNYEPNNCRWVSMKVQNNNTRKNKIIEYNGEKHSIAQWANIRNIKYQTLYCRLYTYHWAIEKALNTP